MAKWVPECLPNRAEIILLINSKRSKWQGSLAACIRIKGEQQKAIQLARAAAEHSISLLNFLSPANGNSRLTSFCTILGFETLRTATHLYVLNGSISTYKECTVDEQNADFFINVHVPICKQTILALDDLASDRSTDFRYRLYDALIIYSRQAQASDLSAKLIFALSALESILLKDANEPIQKNLGERMAFLVRESVDERKEIVRNIAEVYKARSSFVHHGNSIKHQEALDRFLVTAWETFSRLLLLKDKYKTKAALLDSLEDMKMS